MPVGNGGKFTPEARAIYDLVLEMQMVRVCPVPVPYNYHQPFQGLLQGTQAWIALGRGAASLSPHSGARFPETWHLQGRGGGSRNTRVWYKRGVFSAWRRPLAWFGRP
jgi:hypothetical protein